MKESTIKSYDGLNLSIAEYTCQKSLAVIQIIHGMCEHKERYDYTAKELVKKNYTVVISDNRGHGKSIKNKKDLGYFKDKDGTKALVEDQKRINDYIKENYKDIPIYILAHSMGTLITRNYLKEYDDTIKKVILSGAPCYLRASHIAAFLAKTITYIHGAKNTSKLLVKMANVATVGKTKQTIPNEWISYNKENVENYNKDPLCNFHFTNAGYLTLFEMERDLHQFKAYKVKNKDLKILFVSGEDDNVTGGKKGLKDSIDTLKKVGYKNIENIVYPNMRHEILQEEEKDKVIKDIINFFNKK